MDDALQEVLREALSGGDEGKSASVSMLAEMLHRQYRLDATVCEEMADGIVARICETAAWAEAHREEQPGCVILGHPWSCAVLAVGSRASGIHVRLKYGDDAARAYLEMLSRCLKTWRDTAGR